MAGKNSIAQFKETYEVETTFVGGWAYPENLYIVGHDPETPLQTDPDEDGYNGDLWDQSRLTYAAKNPVDPDSLILVGGGRDPVKVVRRRCADGVERNLVVDGRRKVLGGRLANAKLKKAKVRLEEWVVFPIFVDKSKDLDISVRLANAGRLEDPPWVKAESAAWLRSRGRSEEVIAASFGGVEKVTLDNWKAYMNLAPALRAKVEDESLPKEERLPFAVAVELAKLGADQAKKQITAYQYLRDNGGKVTGEQGRDNAKAVVKAIKSGAALVPPGTAAPVAAPSAAPTKDKAAAKAPVKGKAAKAPILMGAKLAPKYVREIFARFEPTATEPLESPEERLTHALLAVVVGEDRTGEGLSEWPEIQKVFTPYLKSGAA